MYLVKSSFALSVAALVGACSTPAITSSGGDYTITQNGSSVTTAGGVSNLTGGLQSWNNPDVRAYVQDEADFTAVAAVDRTDSNKQFSVITGTAAASVPTSGVATYTGRYGVIRTTAAHGGTPWGWVGTQTSSVNFGTGAIVGSGGADGFAYNATISGTSISGTASFTGDGAVTAPITGGFYGTNTLAGVFTDGSTVSGLFYGTNP